MRIGEKDHEGITVRLLLSALLVAGIVTSAVLTRHHENRMYGDATAVLANCPETETVNCDTVNTSAWSELLGVPIAVLAIPTYLLLLGLAWRSRNAPRLLDYAFCIGILTTLYSVFLFYVSSVQIGFICLYCVSLYGVNVAIPAFTWGAARRSPLSMIRTTLSDLGTWPRSLRATAAVFVVLLLVTVGLEQTYRFMVKRAAAAEEERMEKEGGPLVPAGPTSWRLTPAPERSSGAPMLASAGLVFAAAEASPAAAPGSPPAGAYVLPGPLRRLEAGKGGPKSAPFDLQGRLGRGKPVALLFWTPGVRQSERLLVEMADYFHKEAPQFEVYAVCGKGDDGRDEDIFETATMIGVSLDLPLLVDDKWAVSQALNTSDVPNVTLFDAAGKLVASRIKGLGQRLVLPSGNLSAQDVIRKLASGIAVPRIEQMTQYYPATELYGRCAPPFTAKKFETDEPYRFEGKSSAGRPTLLVFWSSTCTHCQIEIPQLVAWVKKNPNLVDVVSVTHIKADKEGGMNHQEVTRRYIKGKEIPWVVLEDPDGAVADLYRSVSTPTTYIISPGGTISGEWFYPHRDNFDSAISEALAKARAVEKAGACEALSQTPAPRMAFDMLDPDGKKVSLASRLDRPALVHLWATWCAPCMKEMPGLLRFGSSLEQSGEGRLVMVSVEDAGSGGRIAGFAKDLNLALRSNRAPSGGLAQTLDLSYRLPRTYIVAKDGVVVAERQGNQDWDNPQVTEKVLSRLRNAVWLAK